MTDLGEQYEKSIILYRLMDIMIGSKEVVAVRRKMKTLSELLNDKNLKTCIFHTGSKAEGIEMKGSDQDFMFISKDVIVLCPDQNNGMAINRDIKTVLWMRGADSRPGYVTLELDTHGRGCSPLLIESMVPVGDRFFISSEMFQRSMADDSSTAFHIKVETHGPALNIQDKTGRIPIDYDMVTSLQCLKWPKEANEWISRPRPYGWPDPELKDEIVREGCQLVPVGDKTSADTFLQWRISFVTSERKLIFSLSHVQFLVYGLLKYVLKQISASLKPLIGETDILSSYIMKTVIFYAVESTPISLWQEKYIFYCFMLCLSILIAWIKAGFCPNYFINRNNLFQGKVHGGIQQNLFRFLVDFHDKKWGCLSVGTFIQPSIGCYLDYVRTFGISDVLLPRSTWEECKRDLTLFSMSPLLYCKPHAVPISMKLLSESKSDLDEALAYLATTEGISSTAMEIFEKHITSGGNKTKYRYLRKCRNQLTPHAEVCKKPGLLATYHFQTGNYTKALELSEYMVCSNQKYCYSDLKDGLKYEDMYCGRGYTLLYKFQEADAQAVHISKQVPHFCPSQLHPEQSKLPVGGFLYIPPLPYALFLSFLCYHELGDILRRNSTLTQLRTVKYDKHQGYDGMWIVHNMLGICYEMVGDTRRALREYRDSLAVGIFYQFENPAHDRIERLLYSPCVNV